MRAQIIVSMAILLPALSCCGGGGSEGGGGQAPPPAYVAKYEPFVSAPALNRRQKEFDVIEGSRAWSVTETGRDMILHVPRLDEYYSVTIPPGALPQGRSRLDLQIGANFGNDTDLIPIRTRSEHLLGWNYKPDYFWKMICDVRPLAHTCHVITEPVWFTDQAWFPLDFQVFMLVEEGALGRYETFRPVQYNYDANARTLAFDMPPSGFRPRADGRFESVVYFGLVPPKDESQGDPNGGGAEPDSSEGGAENQPGVGGGAGEDGSTVETCPPVDIYPPLGVGVPIGTESNSVRSRGFGWDESREENHRGVDWAVDEGTRVHAPFDCVVEGPYEQLKPNAASFAGDERLDGWGNYIILRYVPPGATDPQPFDTRQFAMLYAHLRSTVQTIDFTDAAGAPIVFERGDVLRVGNQYVETGNTGNSTAAHIHVELTTQGGFGKTYGLHVVDPEPCVPGTPSYERQIPDRPRLRSLRQVDCDDGIAVEVRWYSADGAEEYHVYRNDVRVAVTSAEATLRHDDPAVSPGVTYRYRVEAHNAVGSASSRSDEIGVTECEASGAWEDLIGNGSFSRGDSDWDLSGDFWAGSGADYPNYRTSPGYAAGGVSASGESKNSAYGTMGQWVDVPASAEELRFSAYVNVTTGESTSSARDFFSVTIATSDGFLQSVLHLTNRDAVSSRQAYKKYTKQLSADGWAGKRVLIQVLSHTSARDATVFRLDDIELEWRGPGSAPSDYSRLRVFGTLVTPDELARLVANPIQGLRAWELSKIAEEQTAALFASGSGPNGSDDAFRHAFWNFLMTVDPKLGATRAAAWGTAHENFADNPPSEKEMDLLNNSIGRAASLTPLRVTEPRDVHVMAQEFKRRYVEAGNLWVLNSQGQLVRTSQ